MLVILPLAGLLFFLIWSNAVCWRRSALLAAGGMTVLLSPPGERQESRQPVIELVGKPRLYPGGSLTCVGGSQNGNRNGRSGPGRGDVLARGVMDSFQRKFRGHIGSGTG